MTSSNDSSTSGIQPTPAPCEDQPAYLEMLRELGYLVEEPSDFMHRDCDVDDGGGAVQAGPQLVVPLLNARFAANAANARWGSLYDALYGTDALPEGDGRERGSSYNPTRGAAVIANGRRVPRRALPAWRRAAMRTPPVTCRGGNDSRSRLGPRAIAGSRLRGSTSATAATRATPHGVLLVHHGLHVEIQVDRTHPIGMDDAAGVKDLLMEAAVSTIMDLEDSVAAVDAEDKVTGYRNWLQLNQGTLTAVVDKDGSSFTRGLEPDRIYDGPDGRIVLPGRSLMFVRQVGHLMTTDAILDRDGQRDPRGDPRRSHDSAVQPRRHPGP